MSTRPRPDRLASADRHRQRHRAIARPTRRGSPRPRNPSITGCQSPDAERPPAGSPSGVSRQPARVSEPRARASALTKESKRHDRLEHVNRRHPAPGCLATARMSETTPWRSTTTATRRGTATPPHLDIGLSDGLPGQDHTCPTSAARQRPAPVTAGLAVRSRRHARPTRRHRHRAGTRRSGISDRWSTRVGARPHRPLCRPTPPVRRSPRPDWSPARRAISGVSRRSAP